MARAEQNTQNLPDINTIQNEYDELLEKLSDPEFFRGETREILETQKRFSLIDKILKAAKELREVQSKIQEHEDIIKIRDDEELVSLAYAELPALRAREKKLMEELNVLLGEGKDEAEKDVILEVRAGTGGEEAALFAGELLRMYARYAERQGWNVTLLERRETELGGIKEGVLEIRGPKAYEALRYEGGVHRVQRIPLTEKGGRIHTSTASVAVLPKISPKELSLNPADLEFQTYRASGPGGQNVNRRETAVRVTHKPSGISVSSQSERSQLANRENALTILRARLKALEEEKRVGEISESRRAQVKGAERSEKIRTYNFPQDRVTDHRIKKSWHNLPRIMEGELDDIIESLQQRLKIEN